MTSLNKILRIRRKSKIKKIKRKDLKNCPQKKGICKKLLEMTPRKPNSAIRQVARVYLTSTRKEIYAYIPGMGHTLQRYANVLVRGGGPKDLPGLKYTLVRGVWDFHGLPGKYRKQCRSRYGVRWDPEYHKLTIRDFRYGRNKRYWS